MVASNSRVVEWEAVSEDIQKYARSGYAARKRVFISAIKNMAEREKSNLAKDILANEAVAITLLFAAIAFAFLLFGARKYV